MTSLDNHPLCGGIERACVLHLLTFPVGDVLKHARDDDPVWNTLCSATNLRHQFLQRQCQSTEVQCRVCSCKCRLFHDRFCLLFQNFAALTDSYAPGSVQKTESLSQRRHAPL